MFAVCQQPHSLSLTQCVNSISVNRAVAAASGSVPSVQGSDILCVYVSLLS